MVQALLRHNNLSTTARYALVAATTIAATVSPLERPSLMVMPPLQEHLMSWPAL